MGWLLVFLLGFSASAGAQYGRAPRPEFDNLQRENDARFELLGPDEQSEYRRRALQMGEHLTISGTAWGTGVVTVDVDVDSTFGVFDGVGEPLRMVQFAERAVGAADAEELRAIRRRIRIASISTMLVGAAVAILAVPFMGSRDAEEYRNEGTPDFGSAEYEEWQAEYDRLAERDERRGTTGLILLTSGLGVMTLGSVPESRRHLRWATPAARYDEAEVIGYVLQHNSLLLSELGAPPASSAPPEAPAEPSTEPDGASEPESPVALIGRYGALAIRE